MVKKKLKLKLEGTPFDDIWIIGLNTIEEDYKLAWSLNKNLGFNFVKCESISPNGVDLFSFYVYSMGDNENYLSNINENAKCFTLVALTSYNGKEWTTFKPKTDYLLILRNVSDESYFQSILSQVKLIPQIQYAYAVNLDFNSKIDKILENVEFHEKKIFGEKRNILLK